MTEINTSRERLERLQSIGCADYLHMTLLARVEKAEAERDAEWNNAIRAAIVRLGVLIDRPGAKADRELVRGIRELLREGVAMRCAECDCENGGADCNWIASGDKEGGAA